jgi:hypothetical protein
MIGLVGDSNTQHVLMVDKFTQFTAWASTLFQNEEPISAAFNGLELSQAFLPLSVLKKKRSF